MSSLEVPLWWDREFDRIGRAIRSDVRAAAIAVWTTSCRKAQSQLTDCSLAAELMESTVAQVSRYLDRKVIPAFSRELNGLVTLSFQRAVQRDLRKRQRTVPLDTSAQLSGPCAQDDWRQQVQSRLELQEIVKLLTRESQTVLALRYAGYTWKETAQIIGGSETALRSSFWRDVNRVKLQIESRRFNHRKQSQLQV